MPERYRAVLIVCCLEGRSRDEAAAQLGWSEGQVKGRLERAREMLRARLARRGVELGGLLLAAAVAGPVPVRADPPSAAALTLTHGVIRAMLIQKLRLAVAVLAACVGVALAGGVVLRAQPGEPPPAVPSGGANAPLLADRVARPARRTRENVTPGDRSTRRPGRRSRTCASGSRPSNGCRQPPAAERQKVVVTSPLAKDVVVAQQYVGQDPRAPPHQRLRPGGRVSRGGHGQGGAGGQEGRRAVQGAADPLPGQAGRRAGRGPDRTDGVRTTPRSCSSKKVVSQQELALHEAKLAKAQAKAKLAEAELGFTVVRAPFDGLVGRFQQQQGSVVKEGDALTTLSDTSVMWVYFNVPEARYLEYEADRDQVKVGTPVELVLANGSKFPEAGKLGAIAAGFENDTGNIPFRADFPNPKGLLAPRPDRHRVDPRVV